MMRVLAALCCALSFAGAAVAPAGEHRPPEAELVSAADGIAPGQTIHVALRQKIQKGWHTYWRNSGDSGEATKVAWTLPAGWTAGDFVWPAPRSAAGRAADELRLRGRGAAAGGADRAGDGPGRARR